MRHENPCSYKQLRTSISRRHCKPSLYQALVTVLDTARYSTVLYCSVLYCSESNAAHQLPILDNRPGPLNTAALEAGLEVRSSRRRALAFVSTCVGACVSFISDCSVLNLNTPHQLPILDNRSGPLDAAALEPGLEVRASGRSALAFAGTRI